MMTKIFTSIVQGIIRLIVKLIEWVIPQMLRAVRTLLFLAVTSIASLFVGVPKSVDRMADSWIEQASNSGLPVGYQPELRNGAKVTAYVILILGWLVVIGVIVLILVNLSNR